jgi:hypothetical protein
MWRILPFGTNFIKHQPMSGPEKGWSVLNRTNMLTINESSRHNKIYFLAAVS